MEEKHHGYKRSCGCMDLKKKHPHPEPRPERHTTCGCGHHPEPHPHHFTDSHCFGDSNACLVKKNYLAEFKTDLEKRIVREGLGLSDRDIRFIVTGLPECFKDIPVVDAVVTDEEPENPYDGMIWFDTDDTFRIYNSHVKDWEVIDDSPEQCIIMDYSKTDDEGNMVVGMYSYVDKTLTLLNASENLPREVDDKKVTFVKSFVQDTLPDEEINEGDLWYIPASGKMMVYSKGEWTEVEGKQDYWIITRHGDGTKYNYMRLYTTGEKLSCYIPTENAFYSSNNSINIEVNDNHKIDFVSKDITKMAIIDSSNKSDFFEGNLSNIGEGLILKMYDLYDSYYIKSGTFKDGQHIAAFKPAENQTTYINGRRFTITGYYQVWGYMNEEYGFLKSPYTVLTKYSTADHDGRGFTMLLFDKTWWVV